MIHKTIDAVNKLLKRCFNNIPLKMAFLLICYIIFVHKKLWNLKNEDYFS